MKRALQAALIAWTSALFGCDRVALGDGELDAGDVEPVPEFSADDWAHLRTLAPPALPSSPPDVSNRWANDEDAAALGRRLFFEPLFSGPLLDADNDGGPNSLGTVGETGKVACAGCHMEDAAFGDTRSTFQQISLGTGWTLRRTPEPPRRRASAARRMGWAPLDAAESDLRAAREPARDEHVAALRGARDRRPLSRGLRAHLRRGFAHPARRRRSVPTTRREPHRMSIDPSDPASTRAPPDPLYECHGMPGDGAEFDAMTPADRDLVNRVVIDAGKAIAAFERTLRCPPGRFDAFVQGDADALSASEQRGLALFIGRARCTTCHVGPFLSDQSFHNVGLAEAATREGIVNYDDHGAARDIEGALADPLGIASSYSDGDDGRVPETLPASYEGAFRTPSLRCVGRRPTFMHSGLLESLDHVVSFFDRGGDTSGYPGTREIAPLGLDAQARRDLVAFLRAL